MYSVVIGKDDGDKMLENFLIELSKSNGSKRCAQESLDILENPFDRQLLLTIIVRRTIEQHSEIPLHIKNFEAGLLSAITTVLCACDVNDIPKQLQQFFKDAKNDEEVFDRVRKSEKLKYAVSNFVNAYLHFDYFEHRYPEIKKAL